jgi:hypothetical protein
LQGGLTTAAIDAQPSHQDGAFRLMNGLGYGNQGRTRSTGRPVPGLHRDGFWQAGCFMLHDIVQ